MKILDKISGPVRLKKLGAGQLDGLCAEIREYLIKTVSKTGGHLASNLGVVELTVALHYCFDLPKDKLIWDVGHQSYVHKILTGRREAMSGLRRMGGLSGFPKTNESKYDCFNTGHSSTSVSAALGFAKARDLAGEDYNVIAVIGDGSITGGLAYEALNNAGKENTRLIVILNDNGMSIGRNVGAVSRYLNRVRTARSYIGAKHGVNSVLAKIPLAGKRLARIMERAKDSLKHLFIPGALFEELGFSYIGPVDGHNIHELIAVLKKIKDMDKPVLLHALTRKGKGYAPAEKNPEAFHGVDSFDPETGEPLGKSNGKTSYSAVFGETLAGLSRENEKIAAITASMLQATGLGQFGEEFPGRVFDVGIAEGHAATFAAALAIRGFLPVVAVYSSFLQRAYDQIIHDVCLQNLPVVFAVDRAGIVGADGETHQGLFDLSFLSHMPNMCVMAPKNAFELREMLKLAVGLGSPAAIRYPRESTNSALLSPNAPVKFGKAETILAGEGIALVSVGTMAKAAHAAALTLRESGLCPALFNARFVKPVDPDLLDKLAGFGHVFVIEDNVSAGGFGSIIARLLSEAKRPVRVISVAFPDKFIEQGTRDELLAKYGLDAKGITERIKSEINPSL